MVKAFLENFVSDIEKQLRLTGKEFSEEQLLSCYYKKLSDRKYAEKIEELKQLYSQVFFFSPEVAKGKNLDKSFLMAVLIETQRIKEVPDVVRKCISEFFVFVNKKVRFNN